MPQTGKYLVKLQVECAHPGQIALTVMYRGAKVVARRIVRWFAAALLVPSIVKLNEHNVNDS